MATASLLSGRSHHGPRSVRSRRAKTAAKRSSKPRDDQEVVAPQPDLQELRRRRISYLGVPPELRRRSTTSVASHSKPSETSSSQALSREPGLKQRRSRRRHTSTSDNAEPASRGRRSRADHYVYGTSQDTQPVRRSSREDADANESSNRSTRPATSRRHTMPAIIESEVGPDDSISQVGAAEATDTSHVRRRPSKSSRADLPPIPEHSRGSQSVRTGLGRSKKHESTSSLLGIGSVLRRNTAPAVPSAPRLVECLICASDDVPLRKSAKLACGHRMCHECLKRVFEMSVKDPAHMPPKCCTSEHIPLHHVEKLFDIKFKTHWNRKYQEYHTKNKIYCPVPKCGQWIKPSHIHSSLGRKYAQCPRCHTKVCITCNAKLHRSRECPKDPAMAKLVEQAQEEGWRQCYQCHAMVEKTEGCNHITCRCRAEFCIKCGAKWKTCECPWFDYGSLPDTDRLNEWRVPEPVQIIFRRAFGAGDGRGPAQNVGHADRDRAQRANGPWQLTYQEEIDQRQRQERLDADLARRLQLASLLDDEPQPRRRAVDDTWGLGNAAGHFLNEDFVQNAANVVMSAFGDANMGRRGERASGRRRRARAQVDGNDTGLAPNFLGDESVLGVGPAGSRSPPRSR